MSVETRLDGPVLHITLDRAEKRNAFDGEIVSELSRAFDNARQTSSLRVIVLQAKGKHFSAGADLTWMRRMADADHGENHADALELARLMQAINHAPVPVVCRVQGAAFGGALGLIAASDIAVGTTDARLCLSEVRLGILPAVIAPYVVHALGPRQARRFFMTAEEISAPRARELGLLHECVDAAQLDARVEALIERICQGAPGAQMRARELVTKVAGREIDASLMDWTAHLIADLRAGEEGREGLEAFLEKRLPAWRTKSREPSQ